MNNKKLKKLLFVVNVDWFFLSHRLQIAEAALNAGYEVHIATKITDKSDELRGYGFVVHPLIMSRGFSSIFSEIKLIFQLYKIYKEVCPVVVHHVTLKMVLVGGIAAQFVKMPSIVSSISGLGYIFISKKIRIVIFRIIVGLFFRYILASNNQRVIFQNTDDREVFIKVTGIARSKTLLFPGSGVDLSVFKPTPPISGEIVIALISRMLGDKGVNEFVDAVKIIKSMKYKNPQCRFVLVGDVDPENPSSLSLDQIKSWDKEGLIEYWGYRSDISRVLGLVSIVVLPSYREGFPKILMEAAACGRPVITTNVPGCRDAIEPLVTGLLVPVRNSKVLANSMQSLIDNENDCKEMGLAARKRALKFFDIRDIVDSHLNLYEALIAESSV